jgi:hypothetical protein
MEVMRPLEEVIAAPFIQDRENFPGRDDAAGVPGVRHGGIFDEGLRGGRRKHRDQKK